MKTRDLAPYLVPTRFGASGGVVLGRRLLSTAPEDAPPPVRAAIEAVRAETEQLMLHLQARIGTGGPLRLLGAKLASAWVALRMRLDAVVKAGRPGESERALSLLALALPRGTGFVKLKYQEVWTVSLHHLRRIEANGLADEIDALAGLDLLAWVRERHLALGEALGVAGTPFRQRETRAVQEQLDTLADAIAEYGRLMVGHLDLTDPEAVTQFRLAMAPLDAHREQLARSRGPGGEPPQEDDAALPEPPTVASQTEPTAAAAARPSGPSSPVTTGPADTPLAPPTGTTPAAPGLASGPRAAPPSNSILSEPPGENQSGNSAAGAHRGGP